MTTQPILSTGTQAGENGAYQVYHTADHYKRYPSEQVTFTTHFITGRNWAGGVLSVYLAEGLDLEQYAPLDGAVVDSVSVRDLEDGLAIDWCLNSLPPGETVVMTVIARVRGTDYNTYRNSRAVLLDAAGNIAGDETVQLAVLSAGRYLRYLPEIYHGNDLMNRLLMMFESFWQPIEQQINQPDVYYDPRLAPPAFVDWLASWVGAPIDGSIPVDRKRKLVGSALTMYQRFGTRQALEDFLQMFTGGSIEIIEHRANNFQLGDKALLGSTIALGKNNFPDTFTVKVTITRQELLNTYGASQANPENLFHARVAEIIEAQKPAHTAYDLKVQITE